MQPGRPLRCGLPHGYHYDMLIYVWDMGFDAVCRSAPHLIIAHVNVETSPLVKYNAIDCATALSYMELAASGLGLVTCWNGMLLTAIKEWSPLRESLGLPLQNRCYGALMLGYPRFKYHRMPTPRESRYIFK